MEVHTGVDDSEWWFVGIVGSAGRCNIHGCACVCVKKSNARPIIIDR